MVHRPGAERRQAIGPLDLKTRGWPACSLRLLATADVLLELSSGVMDARACYAQLKSEPISCTARSRVRQEARCATTLRMTIIQGLAGVMSVTAIDERSVRRRLSVAEYLGRHHAAFAIAAGWCAAAAPARRIHRRIDVESTLARWAGRCRTIDAGQTPQPMATTTPPRPSAAFHCRTAC